MRKIVALSELIHEGTLEYMSLGERERFRLMELGFVGAVRIKALHEGVTGGTRAYALKEAVIALRNCDADKIFVSILV